MQILLQMQQLDKYMRRLTQFIVFFTLVKIYPKTQNQNFLTNMKISFATFIIAVIVCVKNFFMKDGLNLPKNIPVWKITWWEPSTPAGRHELAHLRQKYLPLEYKLLPALKVITTLLNVSYHQAIPCVISQMSLILGLKGRCNGIDFSNIILYQIVWESHRSAMIFFLRSIN